MIDKDSSGTLTKAEIVKAIAEDKAVVDFLKNCGEENLQFLLRPARLEKALEVLDTSNDGELDVNEWEDAIQRGLAKRLDDLANERERRERAAQAEDEAFSVEFLSAARQVFDMIDVDGSGSLDKAEVVKAVKTDQKVIKFLVNCGNQNLQYLLVPARLEAALNVLDTDRDGEISGPEWEEAIESALANKLEARAAKREAQAKAARKEIEEFTADFVNAARKCFEMIDKDGSGTLTKVEIVKAVSEDPAVVTFLKNCGEE
jgi:Ca2+-binding EF-hand superfamily protein